MMDMKDVRKQAVEIRAQYHELEKQIHGSEWTAEEDALAFLTERNGYRFENCVEQFLMDKKKELEG